MKKNITGAITKITALIILCITAMTSWAFTGEEGKVDYHIVVANPSFWIGVVLFIGFITAGILVGRNKKSASAE